MTTTKHKFETTLALLEKANACSDGLETLIDSLPSDYPKNKAINLLHILKSNGINHFFWAFRTLKKDSKVTRRLIFHDILKLLQPIYDKQYPNSDLFSIVLKALKTGKGLKKAAAVASAVADTVYKAYAVVTYAAANVANTSDSAAYAVYAAEVAAANAAYAEKVASSDDIFTASDDAINNIKTKRRFYDKVVKIIKKYLK